MNNHKDLTSTDQHKIKDLNKNLLKRFKKLKKKHNQLFNNRKKFKPKKKNHQSRNKNTNKKSNQQLKFNLNHNKRQFNNNLNNHNLNNKRLKLNITHQSTKKKNINHHIMNLKNNKHTKNNNMLNNPIIQWNLHIMNKKRHNKIIMKSNTPLKKKLSVTMKNNQPHNQLKNLQLTVSQLFKTSTLLLQVKTLSKHAIKIHSSLNSSNLKLTHKEFLMLELLMVAWKMFKLESQEQATKDHKKHYDHIFIYKNCNPIIIRKSRKLKRIINKRSINLF